MFASCSSLTNLDLSNFNTQNVTDMTRMITGCSNLKTLHLSNKFIISTTYTDDVFGSTNNLNSIIVVGANPVASQFTKVKTQLPNSTFYVPDKIAYEEAWSGDFSGDRIKPILEMLGNENVVRYADEPYEEEGYTVAEINIANSGDYIKCGYNVTISGDVNTTVAGKYTIEYILTKTFTKGTKTVTEEVMRAPRILEVIGIEPYMITEWTTPSANTTIKLPVQGTGLNITVNWGDDSAEQTVTTSFPTHTYAKAGTYKIKVVGTCPKWGYASSSTVSTTSNYYTYTQYLTKVKQFGELGAQQYGFAQCENLTEVSGDNLVTSKTFENVTDMSYMFYYCSKLTSLDVSGFDTANVTTMAWMFYYCSNLTSLDVSGFDTSEVISMSNMFSYCSNLTSLDVSKFDTSKVTDMSYMFYNCSKLTSLDVSGFDISNVTNMPGMFSYCSNLTSLDVSGFDTSKVTDMLDMFSYCSNLTSLDLSGFDTSKVTYMSRMFYYCRNLKSLQLSNKFVIPTSKFTNTTNLKSIILVDSTPLASQFTNIKDQLDGKTFYVPNKVAETAYETSWVADFTADRIQPILELVGDENVTIKAGETYTDAGYTVAGFDKTNSGDYAVYGYNVTTSGEVNTAVVGAYKIEYILTRTYNNAGVAQTDTLMSVERTVTVEVNEKAKMITEWTIPADNTEIKLPVQGTGLNVTIDWGDGSSEQTVTTSFPTHIYATAGTYEIRVSGTCPEWGDNSSGMSSNTRTYKKYLTKVKQFGELNAIQYGFAYCYNLIEVSGENLVTSRTFKNVTDMAYMFYRCSKLTCLDVSGFDTSGVTNMNEMFNGCSQLTSLDVSDFNTSQVTDMSRMFSSCSSLTNIDVSGFNTYNVTDMSWMFSDCRNLTSLDVSNFNTSKVTDMSWMFYGCKGLTNIDVSGFNTSNVTDMCDMFSGCSSLTNIDVSKFDTSNVTKMNSMFYECKGLTNIDVSEFDTSNVTYMNMMFASCSGLTNIDVSGFDTSKVTNMWGMFRGCSNLTSLDVSKFNTSKVTDMSGMFSNCSNLTSLDVSKFNTSKVKYMSDMFRNCRSLTSLAVSGFDTSKVTDMSDMFDNCTNLKSLQLSNKFKIPTSKATKMFTNTTNLTSIILVDSEPLASQFTPVKSQLTGKTIYVPSKVAETAYEESWSGDFSGDRIQPILELVGDENVTIKAGETYTDAGYTVAGFDKTNSGDYTVYGYNVTTSGEVNTTVVGTYKIEYILTRTYNNGTETVTEEVMRETRTVNVVDTKSYMITEWNVSGDAGLEITLPVKGTGLNIIVDWGDGTEETITQEYPTHTYAKAGVYEIAVAGNCPEWGYMTDRIVTDPNNEKYQAYLKCKTSLEYIIGLKQWGSISATRYSFSNCKNLTYVSGGATADTFTNVTNMMYLFNNCTRLKTIDLSNFNTSNVKNMWGMFMNCTSVENLDVSTFDTSNVETMLGMFANCQKLKSLNLNNFNTSKVTGMYNMFVGCKELKELDLSNFDTSKVTTMIWMFSGCEKLQKIDMSSFNTSNVTRMRAMFDGCKSLQNIDLSNFNTSKVTNMESMFMGCSSLTEIDVSGFDTSKVTRMNGMFSKCTGLTKLDLSNFNTTNVTTMSYMFNDCTNLKELNVKSFNTSNVTDMRSMFKYCSSLETLDISNFDTRKAVRKINSEGVLDEGLELFMNASSLKSLLIGENFVITEGSEKVFENCNALTAVITTSETPVENQFRGKLPTNTKLYVPNGCEDAYKEILSGDTDASKIKPIIEPIGENEVGMLVGTSYEEQNYTVAGFGIEDAKYYMAYGYDVKVSGDVNTNECGTYKIEYTLTRTYTDENGVQKEERHTATRTVYVYDSPIVHLYENNKSYYGDWTNQDVVAIMKILSPQTTWVSVKVENGDWTEEPSYADIVKSGEQMVVTFHESLNGKVYFKEVDVTGNATTYQSEPSIIKIDKEKPVVQDMTAKTIDGVIKLEAKVFDNLSGIEKYSIMQSGETQIAWKKYDGTDGKIEEILPSSGTYYLWLKDVAGNVSNGDYMNVIKDVEAPKGTIDIIPTNVVSGDKYTNQDTVLINLNVTDNQTEQARIMYALYNEEDYEQVKAGTKEIEWKQYIPTVTWTLKEPQGINIIYAVFKDTAGNVTMTKGAAVQKP